MSSILIFVLSFFVLTVLVEGHDSKYLIKQTMFIFFKCGSVIVMRVFRENKQRDIFYYR